MDREVGQLVQAIHDCPTRIVLVTAGAGTQALSDLLGVAGATRTLLEALVPYSAAALDEFLGQTPTQYVSGATARLLAGRAFTRARWLEQASSAVAGIACTATIITDRPKLGEHRAFIAGWNRHRLTWYGVHLDKGARDRRGEEELVSRIILNTVAETCGIAARLELPLLDGDELEIEVSDFARMAINLHQSAIDHFGILDDGRICTAAECAPGALLCGAFNPLHDGHLALAQSAAQLLNQPVTFELSATNADKATLAPDTILERVAQFAGRWPVFASNAPTFLQKARIYPGIAFVVGFDTAQRILQPRYYQDSQESLLDALEEIRQHGSLFLVAGRTSEDGTFRHLRDLDVPAPFADLFRPIPDSLFRKDISSTELRRTGQRGSR
jgi:hypothetical protein